MPYQLLSHIGTIQGCNLGPILFSLASWISKRQWLQVAAKLPLTLIFCLSHLKLNNHMSYVTSKQKCPEGRLLPGWPREQKSFYHHSLLVLLFIYLYRSMQPSAFTLVYMLIDLMMFSLLSLTIFLKSKFVPRKASCGQVLKIRIRTNTPNTIIWFV